MDHRTRNNTPTSIIALLVVFIFAILSVLFIPEVWENLPEWIRIAWQIITKAWQ